MCLDDPCLEIGGCWNLCSVIGLIRTDAVYRGHSIGAAVSQGKAAHWPPSQASVLAQVQLSFSENRNSAQLRLTQGRRFPLPCDRMHGGVAGPQLISPLAAAGECRSPWGCSCPLLSLRGC